MGGGPDLARASAAQWARTQIGVSTWIWRCERFVEEAYGTRFVFRTAVEAARKLDLHRRPIGTAPRGALLFFGGDRYNRGYGHVGLALGDGRMISALARVEITNVAHDPYWRALYRGWALPPRDWPGRIP